MKIEAFKDYDKFTELCKEVLGITVTTIPDIIIVAKTDNGNIAAFLSGYISYDNSFYIQYAGVLPEYQKKGLTRSYFTAMLDKDITYITIVENTHIVMMKLLLAMKFIPFGCRHSTDNNFYIEWIRRAKNG
ncbi:MAG: GNAT family N-acetyltransferase [Dehalococcoidales bacterium]